MSRGRSRDPLKVHELHRSKAKERLGFLVVTVSSSRYQKQREHQTVVDESGDAAAAIIGRAKHTVVARDLIPDDAALLETVLRKAAASKKVDVAIFTGGTGISPTDITIETLRPFFEKELPGVGELLRSLSYQKIGAAAILTRATAGLVGGKVVLCLPGSPDAVETALNAIIADLPHAVHLARGRR